MVRAPEAVDAYWAEVGAGAGADRRLDAAADALRKALRDLDDIEARARRVVEQMALVLQASLLVRPAPPAAADAFCPSRLGGASGRAFATLPPDPAPHPA